MRILRWKFIRRKLNKALNRKDRLQLKQKWCKTRLDIISKEGGLDVCTECKASITAPLTKNQKKAFPEIERTGATVVGKGKPGYPKGTKLNLLKLSLKGKIMSILEENVIDSTSIENGILILTISDHLKWDNEHLFLLQEKINSYLQYIESGQIFEDFGESSYETIEIQLIYKYNQWKL